MKEAMWRCADGRRILVSQMSDQHLQRSIAMIHRGRDALGRRVGPRTAARLPALQLELQIRKMGLRK